MRGESGRRVVGGPEALDAVLQALHAELPDTFDGSIAGQGRVWVEAEQFLAHHDALFRAAPLATELVLEGATDVMARLVVLPALRRYTSLALSETLLFDGGAAQLARSPHLGQLVHLGLPTPTSMMRTRGRSSARAPSPA